MLTAGRALIASLSGILAVAGIGALDSVVGFATEGEAEEVEGDETDERVGVGRNEYGGGAVAGNSRSCTGSFGRGSSFVSLLSLLSAGMSVISPSVSIPEL